MTMGGVPERQEGRKPAGGKILRFAQNDNGGRLGMTGGGKPLPFARGTEKGRWKGRAGAYRGQVGSQPRKALAWALFTGRPLRAG